MMKSMYSSFFNKHRLVISVLMFIGAALSLTIGHQLSQSKQKERNVSSSY